MQALIIAALNCGHFDHMMLVRKKKIVIIFFKAMARFLFFSDLRKVGEIN